MPSTPTASPPRSTYRHGDLRCPAGSRCGAGPRRRTRGRGAARSHPARRRGAQRGLSPFFESRQALLYAVRSAALAAVARAMEAELAAIPPDLPPAEFARANMRAVGAGYLRFAQAESGLFRTAFGPSDDLKERAEGRPAGTDRKGQSGLDTFELLGAALDKLVAAGVLPPERRPGAEFLAWSAVHGLAMLAIDTPLGRILGPQMQQIGERLVEMVEKGLCGK